MRLKGVPQSEFKAWTCILKIREFQIEQKKSHTDTHTQSADILFVIWWVNFLTSIYWITTLNRPEVTEPQDTLVHSINSHNLNGRISFKDSYVYLKSGYCQRVWNTGYSKNFYEEQRNYFTMTLWYYTHSHAYTNTHTHTHPCPRSKRRDKCNSWNTGIARMCGHFHVSK
jgi:hypothetical protein